MRPPILRRALSFCLVASAIGAFRTSALPALDQGTDKQTKPAVPSSLVPIEPPARFASKWHTVNWKARQAALAKAGLVEVRLEPLPARAAPRIDFAPQTACRIVEAKEPAAPRLLYGLSGEFAVSADGVLHCLQVDLQSLGLKVVNLDGHPSNCPGGAFQQTESPRGSSLYVVPAGVSIGDMRTLRVPYYDVDYRYKETCPQVP